MKGKRAKKSRIRPLLMLLWTAFVFVLGTASHDTISHWIDSRFHKRKIESQSPRVENSVTFDQATSSEVKSRFQYQTVVFNTGRQVAMGVVLLLEAESRITLTRASFKTVPPGWEYFVKPTEEIPDSNQPQRRVIRLERLDPGKKLVITHVGEASMYMRSSQLVVRAASQDFKDQSDEFDRLKISTDGSELAVYQPRAHTTPVAVKNRGPAVADAPSISSSRLLNGASFLGTPPAPGEFFRFGLLPEAGEHHLLNIEAVPDAASTDYQLITQSENTAQEWFNGAQRTTRSVEISGKMVVFQANSPNYGDLYTRFHNGLDVKSLSIYAETLVVRSPLKLPGTTLNVYARQLRFEDEAGLSSLDTTSLDAASPKAGEITLHIQTLDSGSVSGTRRLIAPDRIAVTVVGLGKTDQASPTTAPLPTSGLVEVDETPPTEEATAGWLHPYFLRAVIAHAKDAYRNGNLDFAKSVFDDYLGVLAQTNPSREFAASFEESTQEMTGMRNQIADNLDYFGNRVGWVPLISLEATMNAFSSEVDAAVPLLYLSQYLQNTACANEEDLSALQDAMSKLGDEVMGSAMDVNDALRIGPSLQFRASQVATRISSIEVALQVREAYLEQKARDNVEDRNIAFWAKPLRVIGTVAETWSKVESGRGSIASGLNLVAAIDSNTPWQVTQCAGSLAHGVVRTRGYPTNTCDLAAIELEYLRSVRQIISTGLAHAQSCPQKRPFYFNLTDAQRRQLNQIGRLTIDPAPLIAELANEDNRRIAGVSLANKTVQTTGSLGSFARVRLIVNHRRQSNELLNGRAYRFFFGDGPNDQPFTWGASYYNQTRLSVQSANMDLPYITLDQADITTKSDGLGTFTRMFGSGDRVTLTAEPVYGTLKFMSWADDNVNPIGTLAALSLTLTTSITVHPVYCSPPSLYTVSGRVVDTNGNALADVITSLSEIKSGASTTGMDVGYQFSGLVAGSYSITPSRSGYAFNPSSQNFGGGSEGHSCKFNWPLAQARPMRRVAQRNGDAPPMKVSVLDSGGGTLSVSTTVGSRGLEANGVNGGPQKVEPLKVTVLSDGGGEITLFTNATVLNEGGPVKISDQSQVRRNAMVEARKHTRARSKVMPSPIRAMRSLETYKNE